jgi:hypothetical protein
MYTGRCAILARTLAGVRSPCRSGALADCMRPTRAAYVTMPSAKRSAMKITGLIDASLSLTNSFKQVCMD